MSAGFNHGTPTGYQKYKCRCMDCRAAHDSFRLLFIPRVYNAKKRQLPFVWKMTGLPQDKPWRVSHPDAVSHNIHKYRTRKKSADTRDVSDRDWRKLCHQYHWECAYCGRSGLKLTKDHIVPLGKGGRHSIGNLVPACSRCNTRKADMLLIEYRWSKKYPSHLRGKPGSV